MLFPNDETIQEIERLMRKLLEPHCDYKNVAARILKLDPHPVAVRNLTVTADGDPDGKPQTDPRFAV